MLQAYCRGRTATRSMNCTAFLHSDSSPPTPSRSTSPLVDDRLPHQLGPLDDQLRRPVFLRAYLPLVIFEFSGHMTFIEENDT
jgi:hypothetical protein